MSSPSSSESVATTFSVVDLGNYRKFELPKGAVGPESIAFDSSGEGPYVGVSDGRILKWQGPPISAWSDFAFTSPTRQSETCEGLVDETLSGRPLGLKFNKETDELYVAEAYFGLLKIDRHGGRRPQQLASSLDDGVPFKFTNGLDIDTETGIVYFTDTSTVYQRRLWPMSFATGDKTGRLLKYDPSTNNVTVLLDNLAFANGVALSKDKYFVLVAETATHKIFKVWLKGSKSGNVELFAQMKRPADNIKRNETGEFWVAVNSLRQYQSSPEFWLTKDPVGVKFDEEGNVLEVLDGEGRKELEAISEVEEHDGKLWIGSVVNPYIGVITF